ncbi:MAG TPA: transglutaminase domain-containing protein [Oligoflexia bacterium]|nr:transglutaminase domain-containing protein [Oligoflexia bacterium]HMP49402.1 transglutaminase domain-containing protein [Oligoflexia bacterium]
MKEQTIHILRYILFGLLGLFLAQLVELSISFAAIIAALFSGLCFSNYFLKTGILGSKIDEASLIDNSNSPPLKKIAIIHIALYIFIEAIFYIVNVLFNYIDISPEMDLMPGIALSQTRLVFTLYLFSFIENLLFWTIRGMLYFEILCAGLILLVLLSGHRSYQIDMPNSISSLTWKLPFLQSRRIQPHELLVSIALFFSFTSLGYTILASTRRLRINSSTIIQRGSSRWMQMLFLIFCIGIGLIGISKIIISRYNSELSQVMNGVGASDNIKDGESSLGFNEASSPSRQPVALLRLLSTMDPNPWGQMLYLRENALSHFGGREMVQATSNFDTDTPQIPINQPLYLIPPGNPENRTQITQAVYVLADRVTPFAIDALKVYKPIKNPNPKRFLYAYTALSTVITETIPELGEFEVGEENWSQEVWKHYLRAPGSNDSNELIELEQKRKSSAEKDIPLFEEKSIIESKNGEDLRYLSLSRFLTSNLTDSMEKAFTIIDYLSRESIYVLKPGHTPSPNGDPIAPYLFGEKKRGFCTHYATAATYLLRLAGIPARVGTGFQVDLQYAKGGDVLVQMGDRHAWPEVYVRGRGWIAIDVIPAQAEDDQVAVPDESLLEQLMSEIDPIEELSQMDPKIEQLDSEKESLIEKIMASPLLNLYAGYIMIFCILMFLISKIFIRYAWRLSANPVKRVTLAYISIISLLEDLGLGRNYGESRTEFANRLSRDGISQLNPLTNAYLANHFGQASNTFNYKEQLEPATRPLYQTTFKKFLAFISILNPASVNLIILTIRYSFKTVLPKKETKILSFVALPFLFFLPDAHAIPGFGADEFSDPQYFQELSDIDHTMSNEELLEEAELLLRSGRGIDARSKFELLLTRMPNDHRPYFFLGQYYLTDVGHFKLAYRYLKKSREIFENRYPIMGRDFLTDPYLQSQYSFILYLVAEAALNLDFYEESLAILDEYEKLYDSEWYPGQRAWVLMKLKRIDEAIEIAKAGLRKDAEPKRTWNILGILLSISGQRELSIQSFARAVDHEFQTRIGTPQASTPLNNAGEVYRELFNDELAESAWKTALQFPDGCDHILPSVNLSILYLDQTRIFAAERVLADFESCFAKRPERKDTEHRTILALQRGKLAFFRNQLDTAINLMERAANDQQWFGKIGTNEEDVKLAAWISLAQAKSLYAESLRDKISDSYTENISNFFKAKMAEIESWWLYRKSRLLAVKELDDFEDLSIRHTDTMLNYPMLGSFMSTFDESSLKRRLKRLLNNDSREGAKLYYELYLAYSDFTKGRYSSVVTALEKLKDKIPVHEKMLLAETLALEISGKVNNEFFWGRERTFRELFESIYILFKTSPIHLRYYNIPLPVSFEVSEDIPSSIKSRISEGLFKRRFIKGDSTNNLYRLVLSKESQVSSSYYIQLYEPKSGRRLVSEEIKDSLPDGINNFILKTFAHREDPASPSLPPVPFMKKYNK